MSKIKVKVEEFNISGMSLPIKPKVAAGCLLNIYKKTGGDLTADSVVTEAKDKSNPLHKCFEWNNTKAGHQYRLEQARGLIRCIVIKKEINNEQKEVRAFVNIKRDEQGELSLSPFAKGRSTYMPLNDAMKNPVLAKYTVDMAARDLESVMSKYDDLKELSGLFKVVRTRLKKIVKPIRKTKSVVNV